MLLMIGAGLVAGVPGRLAASTVVWASPGWSAWTLLDRNTREMTGSTNAASTNRVELMIDVWIAADDLRRLTERGFTPNSAELAALSTMIRESDDQTAQTFYRRNGEDQVVQRLIEVCGLTETTIRPGWWSLTEMSSRDAVRMGECIADGRAAGPKWTKWLLDEMRQIPREERFGIVAALPAAEQAGVAMKNGWTLHVNEGLWVVNCLAITDDWILSVQARYYQRFGDMAYGARICADTARRVVPTAGGAR
ncbi:serine hydrolase [Micromonospora sp. NPDC050397]|uniref:serine hydrolase n=1 Tax=Micromonospora sp. NPDC050397 TaxID=3364279 RepID=UPI00384EFF89